jgi:hypothetical protein
MPLCLLFFTFSVVSGLISLRPFPKQCAPPYIGSKSAFDRARVIPPSSTGLKFLKHGFSLFSDVSDVIDLDFTNSSIPLNLQKENPNRGILGRIRMTAMLTFLLLRQIFDRVQKGLKQTLKLSSLTNRNKAESSNNRSSEITMLQRFLTFKRRFTSRSFLIQFSAALFLLIVFQIVLPKLKSLVTEVSYSSFLNLLASSPQRITHLRAGPSQFTFLLDGKAAAARVVQLPPSIIDRLVTTTDSLDILTHVFSDSSRQDWILLLLLPLSTYLVSREVLQLGNQ